MNYVNGKIISEQECQNVLDSIDTMVLKTLEKPPLDINLVINACNTMVQNIDALLAKLPALGISTALVNMYITQVSEMFSSQAIRNRLDGELGEICKNSQELKALHSGAVAVQKYAPLGVLFHITAGNMDVLPFVSLVEGLLCGNINIIKLPKEEQGITVSLIEELVKIEPALGEYIYAFNYSSKDIFAMERLAEVANAIVVWGGADAVRAVRVLAQPNTKIIEWGHKISFAYVTMAGLYPQPGVINRDALAKLAQNICLTSQLFCSSCQGIFLDTDDMEDVYKFCQEFLPVLEDMRHEVVGLDAESNMSQEDNLHTAYFTQAKVTLELYHKEIEARNTATKIYRGKGCIVTASPNSTLEPSPQHCNVWVKPLKSQNVLELRRYKNYLQTAALIAAPQEYPSLATKLVQAGIVKVCDGFEMSNYSPGEAHDGVFALREYVLVVSVQVG